MEIFIAPKWLGILHPDPDVRRQDPDPDIRRQEPDIRRQDPDPDIRRQEPDPDIRRQEPDIRRIRADFKPDAKVWRKIQHKIKTSFDLS